MIFAARLHDLVARQHRRAGLRVLLAQAGTDERMFTTAVLGQWGILPTLACDGAQAVRLAQSREFDIVFMDVMRPVIDGVAATARIRQFEREHPSRRSAPIVAYSAVDLSAEARHLKRVGFASVLLKPCSARSMGACLDRWCPRPTPSPNAHADPPVGALAHGPAPVAGPCSPTVTRTGQRA